MVAPEDEVPEVLKIILDPSSKENIHPWFFDTELSTGSI
jgi:hypothetical protein